MIEDSRSGCLFIFRLFDCGKLGRAATLSRVKIGIKIHLVFIATLREKKLFSDYKRSPTNYYQSL
jgi:hypothetical protein